VSTYVSDVPVHGGLSEEPIMALAVDHAHADPADAVARVAAARRDRLLRVYRGRLRFEDLEDCYSQATLELLARSRRAPFASVDHVRNALEQKFVSRINDRRRALGGRSSIEAAIAHAVQVDSTDAGAQHVEDRGAAVEQQVLVRGEVRRLREIIGDLSLDQRLVLHCQVNLQMDVGEFCARYGWSSEKFRKVAQRARAKLRGLVEESQSGGRCIRLQPDLVAFAAHAATEDQIRRARAHLANCPACARYPFELERASRRVTALIPAPGLLVSAIRTKRAVVLAMLRRVVGTGAHPAAESGGASAAGVAGGSAAGLTAIKAGVVALCLAGAASGYEVSARSGIAHSLGLGTQVTRLVRQHAAPPRAHPTARSATVNAYAPSAGLGKLQQVRREFGRPRRPPLARAAARSDAAPVLRPQPSGTIDQETREFGFER
jgi:DNA-directed RNA polymerase specialized sigma24 family protein